MSQILLLVVVAQLDAGWLGVEFETDSGGVRVVELEPDGPASKTLRLGDVILEVNGVVVRGEDDVARVARSVTAGELVKMRLSRGPVVIRADAWAKAREVAFCNFRATKRRRVTVIGNDRTGKGVSASLRLDAPTTVADLKRRFALEGVPWIRSQKCDGQVFPEQRVELSRELENLDRLKFVGSQELTESGTVSEDLFLMK